QIKLLVKQTQKVEGMVGLPGLPVNVANTTGTGRNNHPIEVTQAAETFTLASPSAPLMVLFDKGDNILKSVEFKKDASALIYQLKNATDISDRADAAVALAHIKDNPDVVVALGSAAQHDPFWGIRSESLKALGKIGGPDAEKQIIAGLSDENPWVREVPVEQLGEFAGDPSLGPRLIDIAKNDS